MNPAASYEMTTSLGVQIPLVKTSIQGELRDTALETTVIQHYRNNEQESIEAVYTFPLPVGATLLSLQVDLNGEVLTGTVVAAQEAEVAYEDAITDGDSALLLQKIDESLYTLNIGNLLPEDSAVIRIHYIQLLSWQQDTLRIMYPTTIGNRYGQPARLGLQPHQVTHEDPGVEYRADFSLQVRGQLARCAAACPSHPLSIRSENEQLSITSGPSGVAMDRDIVISLQRSEDSMRCAGYFDRDLDGQWVGWLTLNPEVPHAVEHRNITIVVDCSGSMSGISNQQAKIAVREIVEQLRPEDMFNIVKFGSHATALFPEPLPGNEANKIAALNLIAGMDADMGGTEIGAALQLAYRSAQGMSKAGDILLITDGQSYDVENVVEAASRSGIRHFTIGVGTAVAEDMVEGLAVATGGAREFVSPNENMAAAIVRHVKRTYAARLTRSEIIWPSEPALSVPKKVQHAFSGDTLDLFARFDEIPLGEALVRFEFDDLTWTQRIPMSPYSELSTERPLEELQLARVCAAKQNQQSADDDEKRLLGIKYQLQTSETSYLLIARRENKDDSITGPAIRQIPQMRKANVGLACMDFCASDRRTYRTPPPGNIRKSSIDFEFTKAYLSVPAFLRRQPDEPSPIQPSGSVSSDPLQSLSSSASAVDESHSGHNDMKMEKSPEDFVNGINAYFRQTPLFRSQAFPSTFVELNAMGIDKGLLLILREIQASNPLWEEKEFVAMALYIFLQNTAAIQLERRSTRAITRSYKILKTNDELEKAVRKAFQVDRVADVWRL